MNFENIFLKYIDKTNLTKTLILLIILVGFFFMFRKSSLIFLHTDKNVKIELYDCLDSIEDFSMNELTYSPKPPKYLVPPSGRLHASCGVLPVNLNIFFSQVAAPGSCLLFPKAKIKFDPDLISGKSRLCIREICRYNPTVTYLCPDERV